ncbi:neuronal cell adhesion molecule, partial [Saccoglossus kowalevskii]
PMGPEKQNAPGFKYLLRYKHQDATEWTPVIEIPDWTVSQYTVEPTETFQAYDITIQTANEEGSGPAPIATVGFSGEDVPNAEPTNVSVAVKGPTEINVMWNSVPSENLRGNLRGYKVRYSSESLTVQRQKREVETIVKVYDQSPAIMDDVTPYSRYTIDVAAFNNAGDGPYSAPVNAETPEGVPGPVANYVLTPLSAGFYLKWDFPDQPNGIVVGYLIKYQKMSGTEVGSEIIVDVPDGLIDRKKIGGLKEEVKYRVSIAAYTVIGEGESIVKEEFTRENGPPSVPEAPLFPLVGVNSINVTWVPDEEGPSVDEYEVYYRKSGSEEWILAGKVDPMDKNYLVIEDLDSGTTYDVRVRAVNSMGDADGPVSVVTTAGAGALATESSFVTEGWFIGLMCVIVFLLIILLIICIIKRNKGGKYHVSEKEDQLHGDIESMPHKDDDGGFGEYKGKDSPDAPDGKKPDGSQGGSTKGGSETDSMAEYGDQDTGQFNEDGSFIGQYGDEKKRKQQEAEADNASPAAFSTFV